jgi:uncharacterized phage-associated protein
MSEENVHKEKYYNAILYFIKYCNNQYLGATKLNKLLYYLDFISYRDTGHQITGDVYIHNQYGPVPANINEILAELYAKGAVRAEVRQYKDGEAFKYQKLTDPDLDIFNTYEKELLSNICKEFSLWSTDKIVNQTHLEAPWFYSKPLEAVDYNYANDIEFFPRATA